MDGWGWWTHAMGWVVGKGGGGGGGGGSEGSEGG